MDSSNAQPFVRGKERKSEKIDDVTLVRAYFKNASGVYFNQIKPINKVFFYYRSPRE